MIGLLIVIAVVQFIDVAIKFKQHLYRRTAYRSLDGLSEDSVETVTTIEVIEVEGSKKLEEVLRGFETSDELDYYSIMGMSSVLKKPHLIHTVIVEYELKNPKEDK